MKARLMKLWMVGAALLLLLPVQVMAAPIAPSNLTAALAGPRQVNLNWLDNSTDEKTFQIERANDAAFGAGLRTFKTNGAAGTGSTVNFADNSVVSGQTFFYRVVAIDNAGALSTASNVVQVAVIVPTGPTNLAAVVVSSTQVNLTWVDNATNETSYDVDRATDANFVTRISFELQPANTTAYIDRTAQPNTTYFYRVQAVNLVGDSPLSNVVTVTTPAVPTAVPVAPTNAVSTAVSATQVDLTWTDASNNESGFRIERSADAGATFSAVGTTSANVTTFTDSTVTPGATFTFRVAALNTVGASAPAVAAPVTTPAGGATPAPAPAPAPPPAGGGGAPAPAPAGGGSGGAVPVPAPAPTPAATAAPPASAATPTPPTVTLPPPPAVTPTPAVIAAPSPPPSAVPSTTVSQPAPAPSPAPAEPSPSEPVAESSNFGMNWPVIGFITTIVIVAVGIVLVRKHTA